MLLIYPIDYTSVIGDIIRRTLNNDKILITFEITLSKFLMIVRYSVNQEMGDKHEICNRRCDVQLCDIKVYVTQGFSSLSASKKPWTTTFFLLLDLVHLF